MAKIPVTAKGLSESTAIQAGTMLREGWDILRSLQFDKKASILRYVETGGKAHLGIAPTRTQVTGLGDLDVHVSRVTTKEIVASRGTVEMTDLLFVFYVEVKETDEIQYDGKSHSVIQLKGYDADHGICQVIGRVI